MTDYLLQFAFGNGLVAILIAAAAWLAQNRVRRPMLAHLLWLFALVKLVTPPLFTIPMLPVPVGEEPVPTPAPMPMSAAPLPHDGPTSTVAAGPELAEPVTGAAWFDGLLLVWLVGSAVVLLWSTARIVRFDRLLRRSSLPAPAELQALAARLAATLGLRSVPTVCTTAARVSPMVWWLGGRVRVFVPRAMVADFAPRELRWILAHELAHVRRRDHLVRWLEWLSCVAFWWHPVAWWARRNLRANEEICCDALVLRTFDGSARSYANSLLCAVEFLASPGLRPPAMASEINSGGFLERRFRMIVSKTPHASTPRWLQAALVAFTAAVLPLGVAYAQDPDIGAVTERLRAAIENGEINKQQAGTMLEALKKQAARDRAVIATKKRLAELERSTAGSAQAQLKKLSQRIARLEAQIAEMTEQRQRRSLAKPVPLHTFEPIEREKPADVYERRLDELYTKTRDYYDRLDTSRVDTLKQSYINLERKVRAAVESGDLEPEEARQKMQWTRDRLKKMLQENTDRAAEKDAAKKKQQQNQKKKGGVGGTLMTDSLTEEQQRKVEQLLRRNHEVTRKIGATVPTGQGGTLQVASNDAELAEQVRSTLKNIETAMQGLGDSAEVGKLLSDGDRSVRELAEQAKRFTKGIDRLEAVRKLQSKNGPEPAKNLENVSRELLRMNQALRAAVEEREQAQRVEQQSAERTNDADESSSDVIQFTRALRSALERRERANEAAEQAAAELKAARRASEEAEQKVKDAKERLRQDDGDGQAMPSVQALLGTF